MVGVQPWAEARLTTATRPPKPATSKTGHWGLTDDDVFILLFLFPLPCSRALFYVGRAIWMIHRGSRDTRSLRNRMLAESRGAVSRKVAVRVPSVLSVGSPALSILAFHVIKSLETSIA